MTDNGCTKEAVIYKPFKFKWIEEDQTILLLNNWLEI